MHATTSLPPPHYVSHASHASCEYFCFVTPLQVVFFGGFLPKQVRQAADAAVARSGALLVLGSTCQTLSVFRLLRTAAEAGKPVYAVTMGETRADELLTLKIEAPIDEVISQLNERFVLLSS